MYIVKHIPSGKYIRKGYGHAYERVVNGRDRNILTDQIKKARIYTQLNHVTLSIGEEKVIGVKQIPRYNPITGEKYFIEDRVYGFVINPELFEIIELEDLQIKEK